VAALLFVAAVVILAVVGGFLGADSRDGADWSPPRLHDGECQGREDNRRAARRPRLGTGASPAPGLPAHQDDLDGEGDWLTAMAMTPQRGDAGSGGCHSLSESCS
jgi:hypothetical protein